MAESDQELAARSRLDTELARLQTWYGCTPEGTPSGCRCGRDARAHIQGGIDDVNAMLAVMDGDPQLFRESLEQYGPRFIEVCLKIVGDDAFAIVFEKFDKLNGGPERRRKAMYRLN